MDKFTNYRSNGEAASKEAGKAFGLPRSVDDSSGRTQRPFVVSVAGRELFIYLWTQLTRVNCQVQNPAQGYQCVTYPSLSRLPPSNSLLLAPSPSRYPMNVASGLDLVSVRPSFQRFGGVVPAEVGTFVDAPTNPDS